MQEVRIPGGGVGPNAGGAARVEVRCDDCASETAIADRVGPVPAACVLLLRLTPRAPAGAREAVLQARETLAPAVRRVRVLVDLPDTVDGIAAHTGRPNPVHDVLALTEALSGAGADLAWSLPLTPASVWKLDGIFSLARDRGVEVIPAPTAPPLPADAQLFAWDFVRYCLLDEYRSRHGPAALAYLEALREELEAGRLGARTEPDGAIYPAGGLLAEALAEAAGEGTEPPRVGLAEVAELAGQGLRAHLRAALAPRGRTALPASFRSAVLVGAYGGEHIGDIAILGGVLRRLHEQFGLEEAVLMTQRPRHTRHLIEMMETPVSLSVAEYQFDEIARHLRVREALVHAGGPLTEIPKQLVRHLYAASLARRARKPFLMEGIGPGVFTRKASQVTARRLVRLADRITVRTGADAARPILAGTDFAVGHDPAFDYLDTRGPALGRMMPGEAEQIEDLLAGASGPLIGLNIRPVYDLYTVAAPGRDRAAYTREVVDRMERALAEGLVRFAAECAAPPRFVFFPMNAIQFGLSDSRSAYRIVRHLPRAPEVDARVWQADASLDAVVALLRRLDAVVTMRFHATIFALSQGCPPLGIDYRIGRKDKVAAVMEDNGQGAFCRRIDEIDSAWIAAGLRDRVSAGAGTTR